MEAFRLHHADPERQMLALQEVSEDGIRIENVNSVIEVTFGRAVRPDVLKVETFPTVTHLILDGDASSRSFDDPAIGIEPIHAERVTSSVESVETTYELSIVECVVNARHDLGQAEVAGVGQVAAKSQLNEKLVVVNLIEVDFVLVYRSGRMESRASSE